jgi:hypothetical protein
MTDNGGRAEGRPGARILMADTPLAADPTAPADPALAERVRRLEEQLATREPAPPADEDVAERVITILTEKAAKQRALADANPPVPGLIPAAVTAVRFAQSAFPNTPPGVAPQPAEIGFRSWLLTQVVGEFRLMAMMYFDARYRLSRVAQFGVPAVLALAALSYFVFNYTCAIPIAAQIGERVVLVVLAVVLYRILAREVARYRQVLDYLAQHGPV